MPPGTEMPNGMVPSVPGSPASATVGTSGSSSERCAIATASPRIWPARIAVAVGTSTSENSGTWPADDVAQRLGAALVADMLERQPGLAP